MPENNEITGMVGNTRYSVDKSVIEQLKKQNIDAIEEITKALSKNPENTDSRVFSVKVDDVSVEQLRQVTEEIKNIINSKENNEN